MAAEDVFLKATRALVPLRSSVCNFISFEEECKESLLCLYEKHRKGQDSIELCRRTDIRAGLVLEEEVKIWLQGIRRRLLPRMRTRSGWTLEIKRAMNATLFSVMFKAVKTARSDYGVSYTEGEQGHSISYTVDKRLVKDLSEFSQISRKAIVANFFTRKCNGRRKGTVEVVLSADKPFAISFLKRTQEVAVRVHYRFTNEFGYSFS